MSDNSLPADNLAKRRGAGRPKGSRNKVSAEAKDLIAAVAEQLGGAERMLEWVQEDPQNERHFWTQIYPKLLPMKISGDPDNPLRACLTVEFVGRSPNS